eukprot:COSAG03_NODE_752_length_5993_cov_6.828809_1_plen_68_part_10
MKGGDDGIFRIWDLRTLRSSGEAPPPAAHFKVRNSAALEKLWAINEAILGYVRGLVGAHQDLVMELAR